MVPRVLSKDNLKHDDCKGIIYILMIIFFKAPICNLTLNTVIHYLCVRELNVQALEIYKIN